MELYRQLKFLFTLPVIIFSITTLKGQDNRVINLISNNDITIAISEIQRITFNGDTILIKNVNGIEDSYLLNDVTSITFLDEYTAIKDIPDDIEINIYVNTFGEIVVESPYQINRLTVFDINGRKLMANTQSSLNVNSLIKGFYLIKVETAEGIVTKKIIKNR